MPTLFINDIKLFKNDIGRWTSYHNVALIYDSIKECK